MVVVDKYLRYMSHYKWLILKPWRQPCFGTMSYNLYLHVYFTCFTIVNQSFCFLFTDDDSKRLFASSHKTLKPRRLHIRISTDVQKVICNQNRPAMQLLHPCCIWHWTFIAREWTIHKSHEFECHHAMRCMWLVKKIQFNLCFIVLSVSNQSDWSSFCCLIFVVITGVAFMMKSWFGLVIDQCSSGNSIACVTWQ